MSVTITGLTKRQVFLLDKMWSIDSASDYEEWKSDLDEQTMNTVDTLEQLVMLAELDDIQDTECNTARTVLSRIFAGHRG
jgi:hypothetical protein